MGSVRTRVRGQQRPAPDTDGSVNAMNSSLESAGRAEHLGRPGTGRVLIVGARRDSRRLARSLSRGPWAGLPVVGFIDAGHAHNAAGLKRKSHLAVHPRADPVPVLGGIERLSELVGRSRATHVLVAATGRPAKRLRPRMALLSHYDIAIHWVGDEPDVHDLPAVGDRSRRFAWPVPWGRIAKRAVDFVASAVGLLLFSPLFAVVALLILATSGRPIFYLQQRVGQGGKLFRIIKFRSMTRDAEGETGPIWASNHDTRCTKIGDWLRHTNIDELPQLFNVLKGEMSLVGPRPERPVFVERFGAEVPGYDLRHSVPGGMTGWAQVHGWRGRTSLRKRIQYDLDYIQRWSFPLDFRILVMTIQHVLWGKTSWTSSTARPPRVEPYPEPAS